MKSLLGWLFLLLMAALILLGGTLWHLNRSVEVSRTTPVTTP